MGLSLFEYATKLHGFIRFDQEREMKKKAILIMLGLLLVCGSATQSSAQVTRVQMHIAGYLCGN
jgi:hypothetical protein